MNNDKDKSVSISIGGNVNDSQVVATTGNVDINSTQINSSQNTISDAFKTVYVKIEERGVTPDVDKSELLSLVQNIETEVGNGNQINIAKTERWLKFLGEMAPDILDVVIKTLTNPLLGISEVVQKIAVKARKQ